MQICAILFIVLCEFYSINGHSHPAYDHDDNGLSSDYNVNWQSRLNGEVKINQLSIPGTHDTMAKDSGCGDIANTQSSYLDNLLIAGIRALDIRLRAIDGIFAVHHGDCYLDVNFGDVLNYCIEFLGDNPSEFIIMRVKQEKSEETDAEFEKIMISYVDDPKYSSYFYQVESANYKPTVDEVRGKIIIYQNWNKAGDRRFGLSYPGDASIQDEYTMGTNWDLYGKWEDVKNQLKNANDDDPSSKFYINYLSASSGSFPYFVASGHSNPATGAARLSTGLVDGISADSDNYPDFPRVDCFVGACTIAFEGTNILTYDYIHNNDLKYVGIIMADFPGQGLIDAVIGLNYNKLKQNNDGPWGTWSEIQLCPKDEYAIGFKIKIESPVGGDDDTSANSLRLLCGNGDEIIPNNEGPYGDWSDDILCPNGEYMIGFNQKVEASIDGDDTALNLVRAVCSNGDEIEADEVTEWGEWADDNKECESDKFVCGLQIKVESDQGGGDDTELNAVQFFCCD